MEWSASIAALDLQLVCHFWMTEPRYHMIFPARLRLTSPRCIATLRTATQCSTQDLWGIAKQSLATAVQDEFLCQN